MALSEARDVLALSWARTLCSWFGHKETTVIWFKGSLVLCCPRCGSEMAA